MGDSTGINPYLREAVLTASPEQLQLMLYDGAIRFASQARATIESGDIEQTHDLLTRAQRIVCEMSNGLRHEVDPELCARMAGLYAFVYNKLVDANVHRDLEALEAALLILGKQRETWTLVIEKIRAVGAEARVPPAGTGSSEPPAQPSFSAEG